ncbi:hypothetical protein BTR22_10735 [Alkalihalophilus pseudofirmus]|uniref:hypothetical protein n=1 Tax=Alkalihalophilus pseudofirmus TaxID=79885 RepID=UPI00095111CC|nr:hypothetical protein BTR22_10735 [Alkalihalophilus pseudofirmus]
MKEIDMQLKVALTLQGLWYFMFFTNLLGVIGSKSEFAQEIIWIGIPIYGLIVAGIYILKKKIDYFVWIVLLLSLSILGIWFLISGISKM